MQVDVSPEGASPADILRSTFLSEIDTAATAARRDQKIYMSVRRLSELIGGEYGDRVLYELIQNAHDAQKGESGHILIRLEIRSEDDGSLFVANGGDGFTLADVQAIRNIATSTKEIGEGIGNKGVGFRSVEALTDDVRIYSRSPGSRAQRFDGFCFRFAGQQEVEQTAIAQGFGDQAREVGASLPRYLAAVPLETPPSRDRFAGLGYATLIELPLHSKAAVDLARSQFDELTGTDAPVHLFLDRIEVLDFELEIEGRTSRSSLSREAVPFHETIARLENCWIEQVKLGPNGRRWLLVRYALDRDRVRAAVERSIPQEQLLKQWLDWKGRAIVSVALPLDGDGLNEARFYTFLPMAAASESLARMHIDAPFFTSIDRRRAKLDLPLNAELLDAVAEASVAAALHLAERHPDLADRLSVDLSTWKVGSWPRVKKAFETIGVAFPDAPIWPTSAGPKARLRDIRIWPSGRFKVLTPSRIARQADATLLAPSLSAERTDDILALAKAASVSIDAPTSQIAQWVERIADQLSRKTIKAKSLWTDFYSDIALALPGPERLRACAGKAIFLGRDDTLLTASPDVYVRQEVGRRGKGGGPPAPPPDISRKLAIVSERFPIRPETFTAFEKAGLCRRYVATEVLRQLPALFGPRPAPARRASALEWAFRVWQHDMAAAKDALAKAGLHVPTDGEWRPATQVSFSGEWTPTGKKLEEFLAEASSAGDEDARLAATRLLAPWEIWSGRHAKDSRTEWQRFLIDAGVTDGLIPVVTPVPEGPLDGASWRYRLPAVGALSAHAAWREEVGKLYPNHPYTAYTRVGEAWRVPGQTVVSSLSDEARKNFASLIVHHLREAGGLYLHFHIGRYERSVRDQDVRKVATPLCSFLTSDAWFPVTRRGEERFVQLRQAWLLTDRRNDPRFVERGADDIADQVGREGKAFETLTKPPLSLRIWKDPVNAHGRLWVLAGIAHDIQTHERAPFRRQYELGWRELLEAKTRINAGLPVVIDRVGVFEAMTGSPSKPSLFVRTARNPSLARLLSEAGEPVLLTGDEVDGDRVIAVLNQSHWFDAKAVEQSALRLDVDGNAFAPSLTDQLLVDHVPWLLDALILAHEVGARDFERSIQSTTLENQFSRIRLRQGREILLHASSGSSRALARHIVRDENAPTLIIRGTFDRQQLMDSAADLSTLIHGNVRSFEPMLLRLVVRLPDGVDLKEMAEPTIEDLVFATQVPADRVEEALSYRRTDRTRYARLILPVIAYFSDGDTAARLRDTLLDMPFDRWATPLSPVFPDADMAERLLQLIATTEDPAVLRRELRLDYRRFNDALRSVGQASLASEVELRRLFDVWKGIVSDEVMARIRRHFMTRWTSPEGLAAYQELRGLDWLDFDAEWIETRETIDRDIVEARAKTILDQRIGSDQEADLPAIDTVQQANRRAALAWYAKAFPILQAAAPRSLPAIWRLGASEIAAALSNSGVFDFERLDDEQLVQVSVLAGLWPADLPETLNPDRLGIGPDDIDREKRETEQARQAELLRRNSIEFGDTSFNTADPDFAASFTQPAFEQFQNSGWRQRSSIRTMNLREFPEIDRSPGSGGAGGGRRAAQKPPEPVRTAIGLAGELLAFHYLKAKHGALFRDSCWLSKNRESLFPEKGCDDWGYDFQVGTTETTWLYEVKATPGELCEFEMTDNEYREAASASDDRRRRYRILMVQHVFDMGRCRILELPNPAGTDRLWFRRLGQNAVRLRFDLCARSEE
jgi:hypothetical protein